MTPVSTSPRESFVQRLYEELKQHKEHRHRHVIQKLLLTALFFGLGQFAFQNANFFYLLFVVPFIALIHDMYIFAEDYKVKRIGFFLRMLYYDYPGIIAVEEFCWEDDYLTRYRDRWAYFASLSYTISLTVFITCVLLILLHNKIIDTQYMVVFAWFIICALSTYTLYTLEHKIHQKTLKKIGDELAEKKNKVNKQVN